MIAWYERRDRANPWDRGSRRVSRADGRESRGAADGERRNRRRPGVAAGPRRNAAGVAAVGDGSKGTGRRTSVAFAAGQYPGGCGGAALADRLRGGDWRSPHRGGG